MEIVTRRARVSDAAGWTVAIRAGIFRWNNDVSGFSALGGVVTIHASHRRVLAMIEFAVQQPAFSDDWFCDFGFAHGVRFDFVAVGATGIDSGGSAFNRADSALRCECGVAEENALFKFFA